MNNSWNSYYVVFLSAILSLGIPACLALVSNLLFPKNRSNRWHSSEVKSQAAKNLGEGKTDQTVSGIRMKVRFFLAANAALILITLALELVPCVTTLNTENREGLGKGLVSIVTIAGFAILGLLYSVRKGDMGWLSAFQAGVQREKRDT